MLITHLRPDNLWGKKVFDSRGHVLGEVVAVASRRGVVHKVVVRSRPIRSTDWGLTDTEPDSGGGGPNFKRILLALTDSGPSERAAAMVARLARSGGSEVCVVHLVERLFLGRAGYLSLETDDEARGFVRRAAAELAKLGVRASPVIGRGLTRQIAGRIIWAATDFGADLIVIGTHGRSPLHAVLIGSVAHGIIHRSKIPVLVVP